VLLAITLISAFGCGEAAKKATFSLDEFSITLTDEYGLTPHVSYFVSYETADKRAVLVTRDKKEVVEGIAGKNDLSCKEYADLVIATNKKGSDPKEKDGIVYYTYETLTDGIHYTYLATAHKSENAYWLVQFVCEKKEYNDRKDDFFRYAKSVKFNENYEKAPTTT
jgi:hypothetical protein